MRHAHIGFLEKDEMLNFVDGDFRELIREFYKIPGLGTHGVSCSGHFYPKDHSNAGEGYFWPQPWAHLGVALIPKLKHIPEVLKIIYDSVQKDFDARLSIKDKFNAPVDFTRYEEGMNLEPYALGIIGGGLYVSVLEIRLGDNGCLNSVPETYGSHIIFEGNEEAYRKSEQRYTQIINYWKSLENSIRDYNLRNGFSEIDFSKKEFRPFI